MTELERCIALRQEAAEMLRRFDSTMAKVQSALDQAQADLDRAWADAGWVFREVTEERQ